MIGFGRAAAWKHRPAGQARNRNRHPAASYGNDAVAEPVASLSKTPGPRRAWRGTDIGPATACHSLANLRIAFDVLGLIRTVTTAGAATGATLEVISGGVDQQPVLEVVVVGPGGSGFRGWHGLVCGHTSDPTHALNASPRGKLPEMHVLVRGHHKHQAVARGGQKSPHGLKRRGFSPAGLGEIG